MSRDPQYKEKMAEFYSKNPNAGQRETKNELLKISKANIQQSQSIESKNKLDLEKLTSSLNESHERRGREKLTKIELESKEKIKKNQDKLEKKLKNLKYENGEKVNDDAINNIKDFKSPEELDIYLKEKKKNLNQEDVRKLKSSLNKIKKHKGIVESSQRKQKELDQSLANKMSNRVEQKTKNIEAKEESLKKIKNELDTFSGSNGVLKESNLSRYEKEVQKKIEGLIEKEKSLKKDIENKKDNLSQEKTKLIEANRIRVSQLEQKLKTSDNNNSAKIQSHIKSLKINSDKAKKENDKAKFEEMKRKYNQAPETSTNIFTKTKSKILDEFNKKKGNTSNDNKINTTKMNELSKLKPEDTIKEIENKNKEISESEKNLKKIEDKEKKLLKKSKEEKQIKQILEKKKEALEGLNEDEKQKKLLEITKKQEILTKSIEKTELKIKENEKEKQKDTENLEKQKNEKKEKMETLKKNQEYLPTKITNKISEIESEDKKKSDSTDNKLKLEFNDKLKKKVEKEIKNNKDFQLNDGKLMSDKAILDKLNTDPEYKNNSNMDDLKKHYQKKINLQSNPDLQKKVALEVFDNREVTKPEIDKINELYDIELDKDKLKTDIRHDKLKKLEKDDFDYELKKLIKDLDIDKDFDVIKNLDSTVRNQILKNHVKFFLRLKNH